ncbi:hypothetical protein MKX01_012776 [Papaver californicum]|nr:hypothetical protein MKX01_012776 [Papaver californicum]
MDIVEDIPSLERFSTLQNLYQLQQNLDEKEKLVLKDVLDNAVTQLVSISRKGIQLGTDQLQRPNCVLIVGKLKKFKTAATKVMTEVDVIRRFKAADHPGKDRDEILASSTGSLTQTTNYSGSYTSSEEFDSPPQRTMQLDRHRSRSRSRSRTPQTRYSRSTKSYTPSCSSPAEDYPVRRRSRYSKVDPPQKKMGHFGRLTKKIAGMFDHYHSDDTVASSSKEDRGTHKIFIFLFRNLWVMAYTIPKAKINKSRREKQQRLKASQATNRDIADHL